MNRWLAPGLSTLLRLRLTAALRMARGKLKTPGGLLALFAVLGFAGAWFVPRLVGLDADHYLDFGVIERAGPIAMAVFWIGHVTLRGGGEMLGFTPDEVDNLFAAPYRNEQLIRYKVTLLVVAWGITGLFLAPMATMYARHPLGGVLAAWLMLPFLQLSSMCFALWRDRKVSGWHRLAYLGLTVVLALVLTRGGLEQTESVLDSVEALATHPLGTVMLYPFTAAITLFAARDLSALLPAALTLASIDAVLIVVLLQLGRRSWLESAVEGAASTAAQFGSVRSGGLGELGGVWHLAVPRLPRMGGIGPIAWRRLIEVVRRPASLGSLVGLMVLVGGMTIALVRFGDAPPTASAATMMIASLLWGCLLLPGTLRLDFRSDLDRMDQLITLPLRPGAIVLGQLTPLVVLLTLVEWVILASLTAWQPRLLPWGLSAAALVPFLALVVVATENLLFLFLPVRIEAGEAALQSIGTNLLVTFGGWMIESVVTGVAIGVGVALYITSGQIWVGTVAAVSLEAAAAAALFVATTWRFARFDPSRDTPG